MKKSQLVHLVREEIRFAKFQAGSGKPSKFFIPPFIVFKSSIKDHFKDHFKLVKGADGEFKLYISPLMKVTLDKVERGRPSSNYINVTPSLVKDVTDRIPADVRGLLKKYATKINSSLDMLPVEVKIAKVSDKGGIAFFNPSSDAGETDDTTFGESIEENNIVATDYQFTPEQLKILYKFGAKLSTNGDEMHISPQLYDGLDKNKANSKFKQEFFATVELGNESMASQILSAMKKAINIGTSITDRGVKYFVLKGHLTKNGNFNFPNPSRRNDGISN